MSRSKIILLATTVLVLGAGIVLGRLSARLPVRVSAPSTQPDRRPSWLADQLDLSPDQRQRMDAIWSETKQAMGKSFEHRRALEKDRDQAIQNLLTDDQRAAYEKVYNDYGARRSEMDKEREKLIQDANERSRALLDDAQKRKWETLTQEMRERRGQRGASSRWSTTRPSHGWDGDRSWDRPGNEH